MVELMTIAATVGSTVWYSMSRVAYNAVHAGRAVGGENTTRFNVDLSNLTCAFRLLAMSLISREDP